MLFKEIIGQHSVKQRLIQTVKDNRISHAQLFIGPEGSGNLPLAIAYAQYISCENKGERDSCGACPSCVKYNKLAHPDLHFVYPVNKTKEVSKDKVTSADFSNHWRSAVSENPYLNLTQWYNKIGIENKQGIINVEDCNEIIKTLGLKTYEAEFKVMIIWKPERLFHAAAPKLLKILEEPPQKTLFLLVAEDQDQIIKTILSRTQLVKINKISDEELHKEIVEKYRLYKEEATKVVRLANGNYSEALRLIENDENEHFNTLMFPKWMRMCFKRDVLEIMDWVEEISKIGREKQKNFIAYGLHIVRESLVLNYGDAGLVRLNGEELSFTNKFAPFINSSNAFQISDELNKAHLHIERNANPKILFLDLSLRFYEMLQRKPESIVNE
ncbi:hypothetical protein JYU16_01785 [bacterium AH-315-M05]|nr:hypothetical protein [bacterium AH-315-M05]